MRISQQLTLLALVPLIGVLALGKLGSDEMTSMVDRMDHVVEGDFRHAVHDAPQVLSTLQDSVGLLLNGDRDAYQAFVAEREVLMEVDAEAWDEFRERSAANLTQVVERIGKGAEALPEQYSALLPEFKTKLAVWLNLHDQIMDRGTLASDLSMESSAAFGDMRDVIDRMQEAQRAPIDTLKADILVSTNRVTQSSVAASRQAEQSRKSFLWIVAGIFGLVASVLFFYMRWVTRSLKRAVGIAQGIAAGKPNQEIPHRHRDEFGELFGSFDAIQAKIRESKAGIEQHALAAEPEVAHDLQGQQEIELQAGWKAMSRQTTAQAPLVEREARLMQSLEVRVNEILLVAEAAVTGNPRGEHEFECDQTIDRLGAEIAGLLCQLRGSLNRIANSASELTQPPASLHEISGKMRGRT